MPAMKMLALKPEIEHRKQRGEHHRGRDAAEDAERQALGPIGDDDAGEGRRRS